jgi:hypothetical protein
MIVDDENFHQIEDSLSLPGTILQFQDQSIREQGFRDVRLIAEEGRSAVDAGVNPCLAQEVAMDGGPFQRWFCAAFVLFCLAAGEAPRAAASPLAGCAGRDRQILMLIEERQSARVLSGQQLMDAIFAIMHARSVCAQGRAGDALALYDGIGQSILAGTARQERPRFDHFGDETQGVR